MCPLPPSSVAGLDSDPWTQQKPYQSRLKNLVLSCVNAQFQQKVDVCECGHAHAYAQMQLLLATVLNVSNSVPLFNAISNSFNVRALALCGRVCDV
jgi:hypothetical protein